MTNGDIAAGEAALTAYVQRTEGFKAYFVPEQAERDGAIDIIKQMDSVGKPDNPDAVDLLQATCGLALYQAISSAGYGSDVTADQCAEAAGEVIAAVNAYRTKEDADKK